jgi:hypothetical protein
VLAERHRLAIGIGGDVSEVQEWHPISRA